MQNMEFDSHLPNLLRELIQGERDEHPTFPFVIEAAR